MIELEKTYLVKSLPAGYENFLQKEIVDTYFPADAPHPVLRLRRNGNVFELTKKQPVSGNDSSEQIEETIKLSKEEYGVFVALKGKTVSKKRYFESLGVARLELDVFTGDLSGLVLADFEFDSVVGKKAFEMPDFCLADVTQEAFVAGGMLAGKSYDDIENELGKFGYEKL